MAQTLSAIDLEIKSIAFQIEDLCARQTGLEGLRAELIFAAKSTEDNLLIVAQANEAFSRNDYLWSKDLIRLAKLHWDITDFRPNQLEICNATMLNQDLMVIMPTGGGKSFCFQLPALLKNGITIVISPLISLISDQVFCLKEMHIKAGMLSSTSSKEDTKAIMDEITRISSTKSTLFNNNDIPLKLVYVTPERVAKSKRFMSQLEKLYKSGMLASIVIDEAHCCSQYSHDFRPDYKTLGVLRRLFPKVPIIALSATCPPNIQKDVLQILNISPINQGTLLFQSPLFRSNLYYSVQPKTTASSLLEQIAGWIKLKHANSCGIIYCLSKKECETLAESLVLAGISAGYYHADLSDYSRNAVHVAWRQEEIKVVCATVAFGMGINKINVRFVIHHSIPKSMHAHYQESGRAGRDGLPSDCLLMVKAADVFRLSGMVVADANGINSLYGMMRYAFDVRTCRKTMMERFFETGNELPCHNCDHCKLEQGTGFFVKDIGAEALLIAGILRAASQSQDRLVDACHSCKATGSVDAYLKSMPQSTLFKKWTREDCERIIVHLLIEGYLQEDFHFTPYNTISYLVLHNKGLRLLGTSTTPVIKIDFPYSKDRILVEKRKAASQSIEDTDPTFWASSSEAEDELLVKSKKVKTEVVVID